MDHPLIDLIIARIRAAEADGAFDDLPGAGKPLPKVDDPEAAFLHRVIAEAGGAPEYVTLAREVADLRAQLRETADRSERQKIMGQIAALEPRLAHAKAAYTR